MIVSNSCVGARMYERLNKEFDNPFVWCRVTKDDFIKMVDDWDAVDFENYEIVQDGDLYGVRVDNTFDIYYPHYIQDDQYEEPTRMTGEHGLDIRYKDIRSFIEDKYTSRTERMNKDNTTFLLIQSSRSNFNELKNLEEAQQHLIKKGYKSITACNYPEMKHLETENNMVVVFGKDINTMPTFSIAAVIINALKIETV